MCESAACRTILWQAYRLPLTGVLMYYIFFDNNFSVVQVGEAIVTSGLVFLGNFTRLFHPGYHGTTNFSHKPQFERHNGDETILNPLLQNQ